MRIRVIPVYGYGWSSLSGFADTPQEFEMTVEIVESGIPFAAALGQVVSANHPLNQLWILLDQRTTGPDASYNVHAFLKRPNLQSHSHELPTDAAMTGFASVERI